MHVKIGKLQPLVVPAQMVILAAGYFCAARLGLLLMVGHRHVTLLSPASGAALAALLLWGPRVWPGVAIGSLLVGLSMGAHLPHLLGSAASATLASLLGAFLLRRVGRFDDLVGRIRDVLALIVLAGALGSIVSATLSVAALCYSGTASWERYGSLWMQWWMGDVMGVVLITPVVLVWRAARPEEWHVRRVAESMAGFGLLALVAGAAFGQWPVVGRHALPLAFLPYPFLIWVSMRQGMWGAATANLLVSVVAVTATIQGSGPFARADVREGMVLMWTFMLVTSCTMLLLAATVSERRRDQAELRAERDRARNYFDVAGVILVVLGPDETVRRINRRGCEVLGYDEQELVGRNWFDTAVPPRLRGSVREEFHRLMAGGVEAGTRYENPVLTRDGQERTVLWFNTVLRDKEGRITSTLSSGEDITESRQLQRQQALTKFSVDRGAMAAYWIRPDGSFLYANSAACRMIGYTPEEFARLHVWDIDPDFPAERWPGHWQDLRSKGSFTFESRHRRKDGRIFPMEITVNYLQFEGEEYNFAFARDIADRKRAQETLRRADELKTNFLLVAGHELRTPISYILGMVRLLESCQDAERLAAAVQAIGAKARRLHEIIQAMFKLMPEHLHSEPMTYSDVSLPELLEEIQANCQPFLVERNQRLALELGGDVPTIQADREKLQDVLDNLTMNAIKFTPDWGAITVRTSLEGGNRVCLSVHDQGPGIPAHDLPHIFEPFYSGGEVLHHSSGAIAFQKRGMGLGLAIVKHFVEMHSGTVSVSTGPEGTTFTVSIPVEASPSRSALFGSIGVP